MLHQIAIFHSFTIKEKLCIFVKLRFDQRIDKLLPHSVKGFHYPEIRSSDVSFFSQSCE